MIIILPDEFEVVKTAKGEHYYYVNKERCLRVRVSIYSHRGEVLSWFVETIRKQGYRCPLCERGFRGKLKPEIDHDHAHCTSGSCQLCRRGLLCMGCNTALGRFGDSIRRLASAIVYLQDHELTNIR